MAEKFCVLCGSELVEGKCPNAESHLKKMCLNCNSCVFDNDAYYCKNEKVMNGAIEKIKASVPDGFEIDTLTVKPLLLKKPTNKCGNYELSKQVVGAAYKELIETAK